MFKNIYSHEVTANAVLQSRRFVFELHSLRLSPRPTQNRQCHPATLSGKTTLEQYLRNMKETYRDYVTLGVSNTFSKIAQEVQFQFYTSHVP